KLIEKAKDKLIEQKPLVLAYTGDEVKDKMIAGEAAMCVIYAGDGITIRDENPDVQVSIPTREGSNLFFDSMCVVKDTPNMEEAEKFINFMCRTDIAARNREEINYSTPQKEVLAALPADVQNDAAQYPSDAVLAKCEVFEDLATNEQYYIDMWTQIIAE
ncbi:MAG: extracellular solute-binding protein, partial [Clostridia bacterium]